MERNQYYLIVCIYVRSYKELNTCYVAMYICLFTILDLIVEFSSSSYTGSESLKGVPVNLLITKAAINREERIVINVIATSHSRISAEGTYTVHMHAYIHT